MVLWFPGGAYCRVFMRAALVCGEGARKGRNEREGVEGGREEGKDGGKKSRRAGWEKEVNEGRTGKRRGVGR